MHHIRTLMPSEWPEYRDHLLRLSPEDRRLRFGHLLDDDAVGRVVAGMRAADTRVLAVVDGTGEAVAALHLALGRDRAAEVALSVDSAYRQRGIGRALMARALLTARNLGIREVCLYHLAENSGMRRLAREAGMSTISAAGETEATLRLPPPTPMSLWHEMTLETAALRHFYRMKAQGRLRAPLNRLLPAA